MKHFVCMKSVSLLFVQCLNFQIACKTSNIQLEQITRRERSENKTNNNHQMQMLTDEDS